MLLLLPTGFNDVKSWKCFWLSCFFLRLFIDRKYVHLAVYVFCINLLQCIFFIMVFLFIHSVTTIIVYAFRFPILILQLLFSETKVTSVPFSVFAPLRIDNASILDWRYRNVCYRSGIFWLALGIIQYRKTNNLVTNKSKKNVPVYL